MPAKPRLTTDATCPCGAALAPSYGDTLGLGVLVIVCSAGHHVLIGTGHYRER